MILQVDSFICNFWMYPWKLFDLCLCPLADEQSQFVDSPAKLARRVMFLVNENFCTDDPLFLVLSQGPVFFHQLVK